MEPVILAGSPWFYAVLTVIGFAVGTYGTLVGLGGGVILLPVLLLLYPGVPPEVLTGVSLSVVLLNALSGTTAYVRQRRIDYRTGVWFALATIPGTIIGVWLVRFININAFTLIFGFVLIAVAVFIWVRPQIHTTTRASRQGIPCSISDRYGGKFVYRVNRPLGSVLSFFVGFIAGLLGIGGGVIHVPLMVYVLSFPVHIATATSHFILVFTTLTGVLTHLALRTPVTDWLVVVFLAVGIIPGAQLGAFLARRLHAPLIVRLLALALVALGIRLVVFR
jgi:uncharacterized membrane protein YfcA